MRPSVSAMRCGLRGGDVWDQKIRREVHDCALFIPVISANTLSRHEGYFRLEWDLADQLTHRLARDRAFIVPVSIDGTPDSGTDVPESFRRVQWSRLPRGETPPVFVARVSHLLSPHPAHAPTQPHPLVTPAPAPLQPAPSPASSRPTQRVLLLIAAVAVIGVGYFALDKVIFSKRPAVSAPTAGSAGQAGAPAQNAIPERLEGLARTALRAGFHFWNRERRSYRIVPLEMFFRRVVA